MITHWTWTRNISEVRQPFLQVVADADQRYQDVVWSDSKQTQLIDSLMNNYYIPPLIFGNTTPHSEYARTQ